MHWPRLKIQVGYLFVGVIQVHGYASDLLHRLCVR